jgi:polar amino acid transport system substrate-binding protein
MRLNNYMKHWVWLFAGSLFFFSINNIHAAETLVIGTMYRAPLSTHDGKGLVDLITKERFARSGLNVILQPTSNAQALEQANSGVLDGDIMRVSGADKKYPNLIQVPGEVMEGYGFMAFTKNRDLKLPEGWKSLKAYRVGTMQDRVQVDNRLAEFDIVPVEKFSNPSQLFTALHRGKVDVVIHERLTGYEILHNVGFKDIIAIEPPLDSKKMYLHLNKKHEALVPKLDDALKSMINDGTVKKLTDDILSKYQNTDK